MDNLCSSFWCQTFTGFTSSVNSEELCDECKEVLTSPLPLSSDEEV